MDIVALKTVLVIVPMPVNREVCSVEPVESVSCCKPYVPDESCCMSTTALYDIPFLTENWVSRWRINESWPDAPHKQIRNSVNVKSGRFIVYRFGCLAGCFSIIDTNL